MNTKVSNFMAERLTRLKKMLPLSNSFFLFLFAWGLIVPVFNIRINSITNSFFLSGIIFSVFGFVRIFFDPSIGIFCDRFNPKSVLMAGLLLFSFVFIFYVFSQSFELLFITRFLHAIASSLVWVAGWTLARLKCEGRYAQEEISSWVTVQNIAYIIAPLIGGLVITYFSWTPAFLAASLICLSSFFYVLFKVEEPVLRLSTTKRFRDEFRKFFKNKRVALRLSGLTLLLVIVLVAFTDYFPLHLESLNLGLDEIGFIIGVSMTVPYIIFPVIIGVLSDKYGRKFPSFIGFLLMGFGLFMFSQSLNFTQFVLYTFIMFTGTSFVSMCVNAELNDVTDSEDIGGFTGIFEMIKDVGMTLGPLIAGVIASITGLNFVFIILSIISLSSTLLLIKFDNF